jgi:bifunctional DNA-binding transcriptional regulator/antitoxin component of YhaV-PrlF toxin-antitoxin module
MNAVVQLGKEGTVALPAEIVQRYRIEPGDSLEVIDLGGVLLIVPVGEGPSVTDLALEIDAARQEAGLSMDELLASLREERRRYYAEHYGDLEP